MHCKHETGSALIVGLILLLALTILGIAGMGMSKTELAMAANLQFYNAGKAAGMGQADYNMDQSNLVLNQDVINSPLLVGLNNASGTWSTRALGTTLIPGGNFTADGSMVATHFEFEVQVDETAIPLNQRMIQGAYMIGPGN